MLVMVFVLTRAFCLQHNWKSLLNHFLHASRPKNFNNRNRPFFVGDLLNNTTFCNKPSTLIENMNDISVGTFIDKYSATQSFIRTFVNAT